MSKCESKLKAPFIFVTIVVLVALATAGVTALLMNIFERKAEERVGNVQLVKVTEDDTDPAKWGINWPRQYDSYKRTAIPTSTKYGGGGGSEGLPPEKLDRDPWLKKIFAGYAFSIDYRDRRGHAYMLSDQEATQRLTKPQTGSCLHCHASIMPLYRKLGDGDAMKGFKDTYKIKYQDLNAQLHEMGHGHPVSCVDCHDPDTMALRVTRPGFINGIKELAESEAPVPFAPSIKQWREGSRAESYDPNVNATRTEMRSYVCAQCHVEYYCSNQMPLTFPWGKGLTVDQQEEYWDGITFEDGSRFYDFKHKATGADILKAQHPEYELWSTGIHARSGVACADCHMPYMRDGASKVSDHWVRSPLLNVNRACQTCHHFPEEEILARVDAIQERNHELLERAATATVDLIDAITKAKEEGATPEQLADALELHRKAQWRLDFIAAENSMGFHSPQEAARILGEAADMARQGQIAAIEWNKPAETPAAPETPSAETAPEPTTETATE